MLAWQLRRPFLPTLVASLIIGGLTGVCAALATMRMDVSYQQIPFPVWGFLLVWAGTTAYLSFYERPSEAIGTGLYLLALEVLLTPIILFGLPLLGLTQPTRRHGVLLWNLFIWSLIAFLVSLGLITLGTYFHRRAARADHTRIRDFMRGR